MNSSAPLPLAGIRVLDISSLYAAPFAATILGDFGAEVIKIEPPEGDSFRGTRMWSVVGRNKKSVTLDLRSPEGCESLRTLVKTADVIVQNFPREVLERRGIGWSALSALNPRLIMVSVSCFGQSGPYASRPGSGTIGEGFAGLTGLTGRDDAPMLPSVALGDALGAMSAALGTMAALYWRDLRGGVGQEIDVSLYEPVLFAISQAVAQWQPGASPKRAGGRLAGSPIRNSYRTADGLHVVISASTVRHAQEMVAIAGGEKGDDADSVVARWIATKSRAEVVETLTSRRIPIAPVNEIEDLINDRHSVERGSLIVSELNGQPVAIAAPQPVLPLSPARIRTLGAKLGEHNQEILRAREAKPADA